MTENQFAPRDDEASEQTRVSRPQPPAAPGQPPAVPAGPAASAPPPGFQAPAQQQPYQQPSGYQSYGQGNPGMAPMASEAPKPGYFKSLFDLSYENLGAPKFARVFQLLFMIVSGIAAVVVIISFTRFGSIVPLALGIILLPLAWLLLNTLVRLVLEAVVGIVQTAENSEEMLRLMRARGGS